MIDRDGQITFASSLVVCDKVGEEEQQSAHQKRIQAFLEKKREGFVEKGTDQNISGYVAAGLALFYM
jgi:hypothetical protein